MKKATKEAKRLSLSMFFHAPSKSSRTRRCEDRLYLFMAPVPYAEWITLAYRSAMALLYRSAMRSIQGDSIQEDELVGVEKQTAGCGEAVSGGKICQFGLLRRGRRTT